MLPTSRMCTKHRILPSVQTCSLQYMYLTMQPTVHATHHAAYSTCHSPCSLQYMPLTMQPTVHATHHAAYSTCTSPCSLQYMYLTMQPTVHVPHHAAYSTCTSPCSLQYMYLTMQPTVHVPHHAAYSTYLTMQLNTTHQQGALSVVLYGCVQVGELQGLPHHRTGSLGPQLNLAGDAITLL